VAALNAEFAAAWARLQALKSPVLVRDTLESAWTRGRTEYVALLVRVDNPDACAYIRTLSEQIASIPGVEPYPEPYWHITIKGLGFLVVNSGGHEDIYERDLQRIATAARDTFATQRAFDVRLGRINGFPEVVCLEVLDSLPVRELNVRLLDAVPGLVRYPFDGPLFLPHISIARFTSGEGLPHLKQKIAALRERGPGPTLAVREVQLIRARLSAETPALETAERYTLRSP